MTEKNTCVVTPGPSDRLIEIDDLHVSFFTPAGEVKAVDGISYSLGYNEVMGVVGESGSGKSVEAYSIIGLLQNPGKVIGGSIRFEGENLLEYTPEQMRRHEVRPGITGWAQVHGRNAISWQEKFKLDVWYVNHCTLGTDLKVVWLTFVNVLKRRDINSATSATMEVFTGNN